jgi:hypothetical protein
VGTVHYRIRAEESPAAVALSVAQRERARQHLRRPAGTNAIPSCPRRAATPGVIQMSPKLKYISTTVRRQKESSARPVAGGRYAP